MQLKDLDENMKIEGNIKKPRPNQSRNHYIKKEIMKNFGIEATPLAFLMRPGQSQQKTQGNKKTVRMKGQRAEF